MIGTLVVAVAALQLKGQPADHAAIQYTKPGYEYTVVTGWNDELDQPEDWGPLAMENKARVNVAVPGVVLLSLGEVPPGWPYEFQWSGITHDASVDLARYPVLMARVLWVKGYAHLDIDVLDAQGKAVKTLRSSTLNGPGLSTIDLSTTLDPATYSLRLRLIVGGSNSGCSATYDWVRFVNRSDAQFLTNHPDWQKVRPYWRVLR